MGRRRSSKASSGPGPGPSRTTPTPTRPISIPTTNSSEAWPSTGQTFPLYASHSLPVHSSCRPTYQPSLDDCQDLSPSDYVLRSPEEFQIGPGLELIPFPPASRGEFEVQDLSLLPASTKSACEWALYPSPTSVSDASMTSASNTTSELMSRCGTNEMLIEPFQRFRVRSQFSMGDSSDAPPITNESGGFDVEPLFSESFDSALPKTQPDFSFPPFPPFSLGQSPQSFIPGSVDMHLSPSQESNASSSSSSSTKSRHLRRVVEQNARGKRLLAPKTHQKIKAAPPATKIVEIVAEDGTRQQKAQISAPKHKPKEMNKVSCPICNDHKEGFHGDHELRRHIDRAHKNVRKVFVCKDISPDGTFLANCPRCRNRKAYGANYNAAAHLRRVHFNPCVPPKGGRGKVSQGRGGIGGGDKPAMEVLRNWMYEVLETNTSSGLVLDDSQLQSISYTPPGQLGYNSNMAHASDAIPISDVDLDFVEKTTQFDMSFVRDGGYDSSDLLVQGSPTSPSFLAPWPHDLPFLDLDPQ